MIAVCFTGSLKDDDGNNNNGNGVPAEEIA